MAHIPDRKIQKNNAVKRYKVIGNIIQNCKVVRCCCISGKTVKNVVSNEPYARAPVRKVLSKISLALREKKEMLQKIIACPRRIMPSAPAAFQ